MVCIKSVVLTISVLLAILGIISGYDVPSGEECPPGKSLCVFYIEVEERLVVKHEDTNEVPLTNKGTCKLGRYNARSNTCTIEEQSEVCVMFKFLLIRIYILLKSGVCLVSSTIFLL